MLGVLRQTAIYRAGVKAFLDYTPASYSARTGDYRTFRWGKNVELFILDDRSFRSAKATSACGGDIAQTTPAEIIFMRKWHFGSPSHHAGLLTYRTHDRSLCLAGNV